MWRLLSSALRRWNAHFYKRQIQRALALNRRGEVRSDGLSLRHAHSRLEVQWRARDVHPWDRAKPADDRAGLFVQQVMADVDAALTRLFEMLPQVDVIEVKVLDPQSDCAIMSGSVSRSSLAGPRPSSDRMWLGQLGLIFRLSGNRFEPLEVSRGEISRTA